VKPAPAQAPKVTPAAPAKPAEAPRQAAAAPAPEPKPVVKPAPPTPAPKPEPAVQKPAAAKPAAPPADPPKPKVDVRPAPPPPRQAPPAAPARPAIAAIDRGNAVPKQREETVTPPPVQKPKLVPINKGETIPSPVASTPAGVTEVPMLGMAGLETQGKSSGMKMGIIAGVLVVLGAGGYFALKPSSGKASANAEQPLSTTAAPGAMVGGGGWTTTWGQDVPLNKGKQISLYRPSMSMADYRFEFRGQIEKKAMGWIFRAMNSKNYYVAKLEMIKPGLNPVVALVKYSVINGKENTHTQVMLPMEVKMDTIYNVRIDVNGSKFTTYVQDKLVDYWTDDQIKTGGTGFFSEKGEFAQIKSSAVYYLK
jgi:hypothetical protein